MLFCAMSTINITNYFCLEALNMMVLSSSGLKLQQNSSLFVNVLLPHFSNVRVSSELLLLGNHALTGHKHVVLGIDLALLACLVLI